MRFASILLCSALLATPALAADPHAGHQMPAQEATSVHQGQGVVKKIDLKANRVTLYHQAIPSLEWPEMVMPFAVAPGAIPKDLKVGDEVAFTLQMKGQAGTITAIEKKKP